MEAVKDGREVRARFGAELGVGVHPANRLDDRGGLDQVIGCWPAWRLHSVLPRCEFPTSTASTPRAIAAATTVGGGCTGRGLAERRRPVRSEQLAEKPDRPSE